MPKTHYLQTAFVSGVLDARLSARTDIRQYYQGLYRGENVVTVPLGGVKRRPGLQHIDVLPFRLSRVSSGITITAPNGGTTANANDNSETSLVTTATPIGTTSNYIVVKYDLGSPKAIAFADAARFSMSTAGGDGYFAIQYSTNDVNWFELGATFEQVDTTPRTFRRSINTPVTARYWRVVKLSNGDLGSAVASIGEFSLWEFTSNVSAVRLVPFEYSDEDQYLLAFTDRNATVYKNDAVVANIRTPYASADLALIDAAQTADSMVVVHRDHAPLILARGPTDAQWRLDTIQFTNIPKTDFDDASSPVPTNDIQAIGFTNFAEGNTFQLELGGARTGPIVYQGTADAKNITATAENIRKAVQKLYTVGLYGVSVSYSTSDALWLIEFAEDSADDHNLIAGTPLVAADNASIAAEKVQDGSPRTEPVWSATRGYPVTVTFFQGRLYFGGTRSHPQAIFGSVVSDPFNFETGEGLDDDAIFTVLNTKKRNAITAIFAGRDLQIFTSGGEFRYTSPVITPADAPRPQTSYGTAPIKPIDPDGGTIFIQKTRKVARDFLYRYEEDAYSSVPISALAPKLLTNVLDMASWQGSDEDDANYAFVVNGDGTMAVYNTLRSQEIAAWTRWTTFGSFRSVAVLDQVRYVATERELNGVSSVFLEKMREDLYLDCSIEVTNSPADTEVPGLEILNGVDCRARADGYAYRTVFVPAAGSISLQQESEQIEVGIFFGPLAETMPLSTDFGNGDNFMRKKRIVKARLAIYETLGIRLNGQEIPDRYFDLDIFDEAPAPVTGIISLEDTSNWDESLLTITIDQVDPMPFHLLGLDIELETT